LREGVFNVYVLYNPWNFKNHMFTMHNM